MLFKFCECGNVYVEAEECPACGRVFMGRLDLLTRLFMDPWSRRPRSGQRILYALLDAEGPINKTTLMKRAETASSTLNLVLDTLREYDLIEEFRKGNSHMTKLKESNQIIKRLRKLKKTCDRVEIIHEL